MPRGEGIKPLGNLFEKYKKQLVAPQGSVTKCFCEVVYDLYGFEVKPEQLEYSVPQKKLVIKTASVLKNELLLKKKEIIAHLKGRLGEKNAPTTII